MSTGQLKMRFKSKDGDEHVEEFTIGTHFPACYRGADAYCAIYFCDLASGFQISHHRRDCGGSGGFTFFTFITRS